MFSTTLREKGFIPASEDGFGEAYSPWDCKRGTFYRVHLDGVRRTFAVDESRLRWTKRRYVDLRISGFLIEGQDAPWICRIFHGFRALATHDFWKMARGHFGEAAISLAFIISFLGVHIIHDMFVPKEVRRMRDEESF